MKPCFFLPKRYSGNQHLRLILHGAYLAYGVTWANQSGTVVSFPFDNITELRFGNWLRKLRDTRSTCHVNPASVSTLWPSQNTERKNSWHSHTSSMWSVLRSSKFFSQYSHCDNLPLVTITPGLPYSNFYVPLPRNSLLEYIATW